MLKMIAVATMPGNWPRELHDDVNMSNAISYPRLNTQLGESSLQVPRITSAASSSRDSGDELFFDCRMPNSEQNEETSSPSYLIFEPVVSTVSDKEPTDWRRYEPPTELLNSQDDTPETIRGILEPSIARIRTRHAEEEDRRAASARRERPLARAGRASVKPRRDVSSSEEPVPYCADKFQMRMSGGLDPLQHDSVHTSRSSAGSAMSLSSVDSGYASMSHEIELPVSRAKNKKSFAFSSLFKSREKLSIDTQSREELSVSKSTTPVSSTSRGSAEAETSTRECVSCLEDFATVEVIKLSCHSYCHDCFKRLVSTALESETQWPVKCCLNTIPSENILPHVDTAMKEKFKQREAEWSIPAGDRVYCSVRICSSWIPPRNINNQRQCATCPKCSKKTCSICRGVSHNGTDCPQDPSLQATINLAEAEGWKRCFSCHALVEHNKGCRHMTCRCKAEFCYICGLRWRTCTCTDAQLANVVQQAIARRQERTALTAREVAAAEEEQLLVQMVVDFERREIERAIAAADAQRRRDEAERMAREQERRRREEERIAAVNRRFHQLFTQLEILQDIQRVLMAERHDFEAENMKKEIQDALDTFSVRHSAEIQQLGTESQKRISDTEYTFEQEYKLRLTEERRIEDEYVDQLRVFWHGKPEGEYKVREARDELRQDQDKEYKFWDFYRRRELQALSEGEKRRMEALKVKQEAEIKAAEGRSKIDEVEWKRKKWAEGKWIEEVARERVAILQEMEQAEYARSD